MLRIEYRKPIKYVPGTDTRGTKGEILEPNDLNVRLNRFALYRIGFNRSSARIQKNTDH